MPAFLGRQRTIVAVEVLSPSDRTWLQRGIEAHTRIVLPRYGPIAPGPASCRQEPDQQIVTEDFGQS